MTILDELGWGKDMQEQIKHVVRNTRDSQKHLVVQMKVRTGFREGEKFIQITDRSGPTAFVLCDSNSYEDRDELFAQYVKTLKHLGLPYCCREHETEAEGPDFEFGAEDEDDFEFVDPDEDSFEFTDPDDEDGFDLDDPTDDDEDDGFDFS